MTISIVYGNGESRKQWDINQELKPEVITWGCNAMYREKVLTNLVSVDYNMQQEIYESGYPLENNCWFSDWSVIPAMVGKESFTYGWPKEQIHETEQKGRDFFVVQGKDPKTVDEVYQQLANNSNLDKDDLQKKLFFRTGIFITWVEENDKVRTTGMKSNFSAGTNALLLASQESKEIYLLGFDLSDYNEKVNNIYKGTKNYIESDCRGFNPVNWKEQLNHVFRTFSDVNYYWVNPVHGQDIIDSHTNVHTITYDNIRRKLCL